MPLPGGIESIAGAHELYDWFGYWPGFHDAEVLKFRLNIGEPSYLVVHTWEMTKEVNAHGAERPGEAFGSIFPLTVSTGPLRPKGYPCDSLPGRLKPPRYRECYNGHSGDHMRISSVRDFRDRATALFRSDDPILVTRRGKVAGVFLPWREATLPVDFKRELFAMLTADIARRLKKKRVTEKAVLRDFERWRKGRRESGRRR